MCHPSLAEGCPAITASLIPKRRLHTMHGYASSFSDLRRSAFLWCSTCDGCLIAKIASVHTSAGTNSDNNGFILQLMLELHATNVRTAPPYTINEHGAPTRNQIRRKVFSGFFCIMGNLDKALRSFAHHWHKEVLSSTRSNKSSLRTSCC